MKMESRSKVMTLTAVALLAFVLPLGTTALVPYNPRSIWDMMLPSLGDVDPLRILEQSTVDDKAVALARADWRETAAEHLISIDVPGMRKEDVKIEVEDNRVVRVSGERKAEEEIKDERWHVVERTAGKFWRRFRMPANADVEKVSAHLEEGVLRIRVPKMKEEEMKKEPKLITIASSHDDDHHQAVNSATKNEL